MATTPILSIPYPVGTDRVMDGDNAMQAIAERVEALIRPVNVVAQLTADMTTLGTGVLTVAPFTESLDNANAYAGNVFTAPVAGTYLFTGQCLWKAGVNSGVRHVGLWSSPADVELVRWSITGVSYTVSYHFVRVMTAGEGITVKVASQDTPSSNSILYREGTWLRIARLPAV